MLWEVCDVLCGMPVFSLGDTALLSWTLPEFGVTPWLFAAEESIFSGKSPAEAGQMVLHFVLLWTGMAVIVGSLAKLMLPGARPYGTCATMILGMFASTIGCFSTRYVFQEFFGRENFDPISLPGILVSVFVACVFLGFYQMVAKGVEPRE